MKIQALVVFIISLLLCSCSHYYYVPNIQNVPLFREKDEFRVSGSYGFGDESNCFELQGAMSAGKHIGITSSFMSAKSERSDADGDWGKGSYIELAGGYFTPINKYGVFEVYGGFGGAGQTHQFSSYNYNGGQVNSQNSRKAHLRSNRLFIQPAVGFEFKAFEVAFSSRFCRLSFTDVDYNLSIQDNEWDLAKLTTISNDRLYYFVEPAVTLRVGWKSVKIQAQFSMGSYQFNPDLPFETFHLGIGVQVAFGERFKETSDK